MKPFVQPLENNFDEVMDFAVKNDLNIELGIFTFPHHFSEEHIHKWKEKFRSKNFKGEVFLHGVFIDNNPVSLDKDISQASKEKILKNIEIAAELKIKAIVFHSSYNPLIGQESYKNDFITRNINFWKDIVTIAKQHDILILFENMFDDDPEMINKIIKGINDENFKFCFDIAHASLHSKVAIQNWINILKDHLYYIHLSNTFGVLDDHNSLTNGKIDYSLLLSDLRKINESLIYCLEMSPGEMSVIEEYKESLAVLSGLV